MASLCQFPGNMLLYRNKAEAEPKLALKMFTCLRDFEFMTQKNKHTHAHTEYDWPHIVFSFIELPNRTANALDKCNSDVKNVLRFEIYWNLFAVSYWLAGADCAGRGWWRRGKREPRNTPANTWPFNLCEQRSKSKTFFMPRIKFMASHRAPTLSTHSLFLTPSCSLLMYTVP